MVIRIKYDVPVRVSLKHFAALLLAVFIKKNI
jgi:hypothetical protein